jgi:anti-sigma regulatory factor (Ser/Thr protein kinase)
MPAAQKARTNGNAPSAGEHADIQLELQRLRTECRRQASSVGALGEAVGALRTGARALRAENADLRAEIARIGDRRPVGSADERETADDERTEDRIALDVKAPAAARAIATAALRGRVPAIVLDSARLLATELATNSVLHSGAGADATLIVRVARTRATVRLEVEDPGEHGMIAPRAADLVSGGGFGLEIVQALSQSWGFERAAGGTRVWARLSLPDPSRTPSSASVATTEPGAAG